MGKTIIFGRVFSFTSSKTDKEYYKIDYLDVDGASHSEFIDKDSYFKIKMKNLSAGDIVNAVLELNQFNRGEIVDCTTEN